MARGETFVTETGCVSVKGRYEAVSTVQKHGGKGKTVWTQGECRVCGNDIPATIR